MQKGTGMVKMIDLQQSRNEIDRIDKQIVSLFEERMEIAKDVAAYKIKTGKKVLDKERENEKLRVLQAMASNDFNKHGITELFTQIMSMSRKYQYGLMSAGEQELPLKEIESLHRDKKMKVVCFGVKGSYTEQAMEEYFNTDIECFYAPTFKEIMEVIKIGEADYGVLPIENTSTGGIADIYDLLVEYDNYIIGEHVVKVQQALLGLPEAKLEDIKKVYSHPQALMQCSKFLESHLHMSPVEWLSTSDSAKKVQEDQDITQGAIASVRAAKCYKLKVLKESINHENTNSTRFIIITKKKEFIKNANKISICFELPHESGSLYNMLSHFIYNNLNMTKIESRPLEGHAFEYRFFVDFTGNLKEPSVKNALLGIQEEAIGFRILGNYHMV
ncbi:prephenate dehydratase [Anaerocolumna aminovalerica]|uniref:prephenate dehydratase n=1 Tax=Anaerocolumna aminovalerica TaxID=1527 RepID=UPI0020A21F21|nr:prephenate dehydratase [Anaerocolumna aminovalerica]